MTKPIWTDTEWSMDLIKQVYDKIEDIALNELHLDLYPNQIEIINSEQMVDAYTSIGMPIMYNHWSFGKDFVREWESYKKGRSGLAYELVINSSPCINYLMEDNSMTMQALVLAHAGAGHNHFFKNNYLFREWTDAEAITDYLNFSRNFINRAEVKYGEKEVSGFLDAAHALMKYGVNRYKRPSKISMDVRKERARQKEEYLRSRVSELDRLAPSKDQKEEYVDPDNILKDIPEHPEENILYFCEKHGDLKGWQREILRIVRKIGQYFYPQSQTKIMNEGFASRVHYKILGRLHDKGFMTDGSYLEAISSHAGVLFQPMAGSRYYSGFNPYKLGFEIYKDIERICSEPTDEDRRWFPNLIGADPWQTVLDATRDYRDESFILQFLSPKVIRDFRLYHVNDVAQREYYVVDNIHDDRGYQNIREKLSEMQEWDVSIPNIEITKFDRKTRVLHLQHTDKRGRSLSRHNWGPMNKYLSVIWGGPVELVDKVGKPKQAEFVF